MHYVYILYVQMNALIGGDSEWFLSEKEGPILWVGRREHRDTW